MRRRDLDISVPPPRLVDPRGVGGLNTSRERSYRIYAFVRGHGETGIAESSASIPFWVGAQKECHTAKPGEQCFRPGVPHCFTYLLYPRKFLIVEGCALVPPRQFIRNFGRLTKEQSKIKVLAGWGAISKSRGSNIEVWRPLGRVSGPLGGVLEPNGGILVPSGRH